MHSTDLRIDKTALPYLGVLSGMCLVVQLITAARGSRIDLVAALLLVPVGLYYAYFQYASRVELSKVRFGRLVVHAIGFLVVNLSYHVHATLLLVFGKRELLDENWAGVVLGMFVFWGLGFLVHLIASVAMRGYEDLKV